MAETQQPNPDEQRRQEQRRAEETRREEQRRTGLPARQTSTGSDLPPPDSMNDKPDQTLPEPAQLDRPPYAQPDEIRVNPTERREERQVRQAMLEDQERRPDLATLGTPNVTDSSEIDTRTLRERQEEWPTKGWAPGTEPPVELFEDEKDGRSQELRARRPLGANSGRRDDKLVSETGEGTRPARGVPPAGATEHPKP